MADHSTPASECVIDHIILLVSKEEFDNPPAWLSENFNILEGGVHSGQPSRNKLIVFRDGTYLELFNWYDKPPDEDAQNQPMRVWAKKRPGLIDFSLSSLPPATADSHFDARVARLKAEDSDGGLGVTYTPPEAGGRMRKDGVEVKWKLSRPKFSRAVHTPSEDLFPNGRIDAPFFCYDVTSRDVRVPFEDREKTSHPGGATGVSAVEMLVPKAQLDAYIKLYSNILGSIPRAVNEHERGEGATFEIGLPVREAGLSRIRIRAEENEGDIAWLKERGVGISRVVLSVGGREKYGKAQLGAEGVASTIWME